MNQRPLRVLVVEDSEADTELVLREITRAGFKATSLRVETEAQMRAALTGQEWDVVLSDYSLPTFSAPAALATLKSTRLDLPFIIISGTIGEETAVEALKAGAHDFLVKGRYARLAPAIDRELREAATRRRQRDAEDSLRESEERFRTLVQSMNDVVFMLDPQQRYIGLFGRWPKTSSTQPKDWLGKRASEVIGKAAEVHERANQRALAGESLVYEYPEPGTQQQYQASLSPVRDAAGAVVALVGISRDITELKRLQAQLMISDRMASVGMMAAGVAHEINNPLASVMTNLDLAMREVAELKQRMGGVGELEELVSEARIGAERVRQIARDLKVFSRSDDERRGPVDLERVLESSLRIADNEIRHRARVVKAFGKVPPVLANESRLGQVFLNLIINAAQAITEGNLEANEIRLTTRVGADGKIIAEVADTGAGMSAETQEHLFTPFFTTKPAGVGTGLGLSICQRIVDGMGGQLHVESTLGKGTMFRVTLPAATAEAPTLVRTLSVKSASRRGKILIVDDERVLANAIRRLLAPEHDVEVVNRAQDALEKIKAGARYDVILSDLMMPDMTGMDLFAELKTATPEQAEAIIFMTGGAFTPRARSFLDGIGNQRVEKPFDAQHLLGLVNDRIR